MCFHQPCHGPYFCLLVYYFLCHVMFYIIVHSVVQCSVIHLHVVYQFPQFLFHFIELSMSHQVFITDCLSCFSLVIYFLTIFSHGFYLFFVRQFHVVCPYICSCYSVASQSPFSLSASRLFLLLSGLFVKAFVTHLLLWSCIWVCHFHTCDKPSLAPRGAPCTQYFCSSFLSHLF